MSLGLTSYSQNQNRGNVDPISLRSSRTNAPVQSSFEISLPISGTAANVMKQIGSNFLNAVNVTLMLGIFACFVVITTSVWDIKNRLE